MRRGFVSALFTAACWIVLAVMVFMSGQAVYRGLAPERETETVSVRLLCVQVFPSVGNRMAVYEFKEAR